MTTIDYHPEPPKALHGWNLPIVESIPPWYRTHRADRDALYYNRTRIGRFNAPNGEFGVLYLGTDPYCAFIESFGQAMRRDDRGISVIADRDLADRCLCRIDFREQHHPFRLVDLTGEGLARIGADNRLNTTTSDRGLPRRWALALWQHPQQPDGLLYRVRHDPARFGVALFDRTEGMLVANHDENILARSVLLAPILKHYGFALLP